ncbi:hypothetical protein PRK78_007135 [Emydomyces testavorans]|uniref:HNH nuclease domain-containing protein n=1 Tax=Emydomyces testavorans TaxID=2070801 RepID=A0AAF0DMQ2_9EURO|nr:hypothetical protein PRK78_007135 [Emydomyces testavorans]
MLSGTPVINDLFVGFTASHIFPHAREGEWLRRNFHSIVTDSAPARQIGFTKIHSPQNGILIFGGNHALFDEFLVSVNPDDGYKITYFAQDNVGLDGRILGFACRDPQNPLRVRDEFLRWHFHTAVLAHMRAAAERPWEMDFPDGDMMGEIMSQSDAAERMEVELFTRLGISM